MNIFISELEIDWTMRGAFYGTQVILEELGYDKENLDAYREYVFGTLMENFFWKR